MAAPNPAVAMPKPIIEDMAWCWWTRPRAVQIGGMIYFGALDSKGQMIAATYELATGRARKMSLAVFEDDDHNNPALVAAAGRPLVAFYSRHDADDALRFRRSVRPLDIDDWEAERVLHFGGLTTYAEVHARDDELHLFTRVDDTRWGYCRSPDWAKTWDTPRDFLAFDTDQEVYMATVMLPDRRTVRMTVSGHPKEYEQKPLHDVWACLIDLETGDVSLPRGGAAIANLFDGRGLPLDYPRLEKVFTSPPERTVNVLDVGDGPIFEIAFSSKRKDDHSTTDARYQVTSLRDGEWITEDVANAGQKFGYIDAGFYVGGVAFPADSESGSIFLTREEAGVWHLERAERDASGKWQAWDLVSPSSTRLTRPWAVTNPVPGFGVVALAIERYGDSYFGTLSHLIAADGADDA